MQGNLMDTIRSRIEAIRGQRTGAQRTRGQEIEIPEIPEIKILTRAREGIEIFKTKGVPGIVERFGEKFPALKRVRGQIEPFERPALFERGLTGARRDTARFVSGQGSRKQEIAGGRVLQPPEKPALF